MHRRYVAVFCCRAKGKLVDEDTMYQGAGRLLSILVDELSDGRIEVRVSMITARLGRSREQAVTNLLDGRAFGSPGSLPDVVHGFLSRHRCTWVPYAVADLTVDGLSQVTDSLW
jgi:hypothetical protein